MDNFLYIKHCITNNNMNINSIIKNRIDYKNVCDILSIILILM